MEIIKQFSQSPNSYLFIYSLVVETFINAKQGNQKHAALKKKS